MDLELEFNNISCSTTTKYQRLRAMTTQILTITSYA